MMTGFYDIISSNRPQRDVVLLINIRNNRGPKTREGRTGEREEKGMRKGRQRAPVSKGCL